MPAAVWNTLSEALKHVHHAFPVRAGIGPPNGGLVGGLRYAIDPNPFDPGFPGWGPLGSGSLSSTPLSKRKIQQGLLAASSSGNA